MTNLMSKRDRIFRLILNGKIGGQIIVGAFSPAVIGPTLVKEFPEIENFVRMNGRGPTIVRNNNQIFTEEHLVEADSSFFEFFSIPVLKGDPGNLLNAPNKVILRHQPQKRYSG